MPQIYATHVKYSRVGKSSNEFLAPLGSDLNTAMIAFSKFFKEKTGKEWEERMDGISPPPKMDGEGNQVPAHEGWFYYEEQKTMLSFFLRHGMSKTSTAITAQQGHVGSSLLDDTGDKQDHSDKTLDLEHREDKLQEKENSASGLKELGVCADGP